MSNQRGFTLVKLLVVIMICVMLLIAIPGWVKNIIKLTNCDFKAPYKAEVIHTIGILPPVGAVTGWLNVGN